MSNITVPFLGLVDLALMGHLKTKVYIGAKATAAMRNTLFFATFVVFAPIYFFLNPLGKITYYG